MTDTVLPPVLDADGLLLRAPTTADIPDLVDACQDREISRWTTVPWPYTVEDAESFVATAARQAGERVSQDFVIVRPGVDRVLGACGLHHVDEPASTTQIGYWLGPTIRGQGVGGRAVMALVRALLMAGFERLEAEVIVGNEPSRRLLDRVGFVEEGILRSVFADRCGVGSPRLDLHLYSLIRSDVT